MFVSNERMGVYLLVLFGFLLLLKPTSNYIDDHTTKQPWFDAQIAVMLPNDSSPRIRYTRHSNRPTSGPWTAWVAIENNSGDWEKVCGGDGTGNYSPDDNGTKVLSWSYFIGRACAVPKRPYKVCADWNMTDNANRKRYFGPICSGEQAGR